MRIIRLLSLFILMLTLMVWTAAAQRAVTGNIVGLTVLVEFPDMTTRVTRAQVDDWLNSGKAGTVRGYFHDASNGKLNYTNVITSKIKMDHPKSYYDINVSFTVSRTHVDTFLEEILQKLSRMNVDLSKVTKDENNRVLALNIFYAGSASHSWRHGLWPHAGTYRSSVTINGVGFSRYQITDGLGTTMPGVRTFAHENGHMLMGWPDLYTNAGGDSGMGGWCLMARGMTPNPYFRHAAGWINVTDITNARNGAVFSINANSHTAYVYRRNEKEAFYIEAKNSDVNAVMGRIPASGGLAIWHVNTDDSLATTGRYPVRLIQADGRNDLANGNGGDETDLFRAGVNPYFSSITHPVSHWTDGTPSGLKITGISALGPVMTFTIGDMPSAVISNFLTSVLSYEKAQRDMVIELNQDMTLDVIVHIPVPAVRGVKLTIRSADPSRPVTIKRGHSGELFRTAHGRLGRMSVDEDNVFTNIINPAIRNNGIAGATLILENIILDGDAENFPDNSTPLVKVCGIDIPIIAPPHHRAIAYFLEGSSFIMNNGAVLRNNMGGGVVVEDNSIFIMNGGEISGNTANTVIVTTSVQATFTMKMTSERNYTGGGVNVDGYRSVFIMNGGRILNNRGASVRNVGEEINVSSEVSRIDLNGGVIVGVTDVRPLIGQIIPLFVGRHNLNGTVSAMWNTPRRQSGSSQIDTSVPYYSNGMFHYAEGSVTDLVFSPHDAAAWGLQNGVSGIVYKIGAAAGFVPIDGVKVGSAQEGVTSMSTFAGMIRDHAATRGDVVINIGRDIKIDSRVTIPAAAPGGRLIIRSVDPSSPAVLSRGITGHLFTLSAGANVVLEDIIIDGDSGGSFAAAGGVLIRAERNSSLTLNNGAVIRNNSNLRLQGSGIVVIGSLNMTGGEVSGNITSPTLTSSGGVSIDRYGSFTMSGGLITGNTGGVSADRDTAFTMSGGRISGNAEHGVNSHNTTAAQAVLTMTGGEISDNLKRGVRGTLTMSGGKISGNKDSGVNGTLVMTGGEISGNFAQSDGGGVLVPVNGSFNMSGGIISGNSSERGGGGVSVSASGRNFSVFVMTGGEIRDNKAFLGSGVIVRGQSTFTLENGKISGNAAVRSGGGVHVEGVFSMTGGEINGNSAEQYGGGVDIDGVLNLQGGVIRGNTAGSRINNVNVSISGTLNKTGGEIIDIR